MTDTGFFNPHFIRDSGLIQVFLGAVLGLGMNRPAHCLELWAAAPSWLIAQAVFHLWEVAVGICAPAVIPRDFPAVNLPALMGVALTVWAWRTGGHPDGPDACPPVDVAIRPKTFIASPFTGGISAFAVILPKPLGKHSPS